MPRSVALAHEAGRGIGRRARLGLDKEQARRTFYGTFSETAERYDP